MAGRLPLGLMGPCHVCLARAKQWKYNRSRDLVEPPKSHNTEMPERTRLAVMQKTPSLWSMGELLSTLGQFPDTAMKSEHGERKVAVANTIFKQKLVP